MLKTQTAANRGLILHFFFLYRLREGGFAELKHQKGRFWNRSDTWPWRSSLLCSSVPFSGYLLYCFSFCLQLQKKQRWLAGRVNMRVAAAYPATKRWECFSCIGGIYLFCGNGKRGPRAKFSNILGKAKRDKPSAHFSSRVFFFFFSFLLPPTVQINGCSVRPVLFAVLITWSDSFCLIPLPVICNPSQKYPSKNDDFGGQKRKKSEHLWLWADAL